MKPHIATGTVGLEWTRLYERYNGNWPREHLPLPVAVHSEDYSWCARFTKGPTSGRACSTESAPQIGARLEYGAPCYPALARYFQHNRMVRHGYGYARYRPGVVRNRRSRGVRSVDQHAPRRAAQVHRQAYV